MLATLGRTDEPVRFLEALDAQTCRDFRLIVVDQNADDRITKVLQPFEGAFPILHLIAPPELSKARNVALKRVAADYVAFPDDDCWYPPDLIRGVTTFFASQSGWDGLVGRAIDEEGRPSAGRADSGEGAMSVFNLWRRVTSYTLFLRRSVIDAVGPFDEGLGLGSATPWRSGEDLDYVLRALRTGSAIYYDSAIEVYHPGRREHASSPDVRQGYSYGAGFGRALGKNGMPAWFAAYCIARSFAAAALSSILGKRGHARFYWAVGKGRLRGWRSVGLQD